MIARRGAVAQQSQSRYLNVLDRLQLTPNHALLLVSMAGRIILVGQGDKEFSMITEMREEELIQYLEENPLSDPDSSGMTFLRNLRDAMLKMRNEK